MSSATSHYWNFIRIYSESLQEYFEYSLYSLSVSFISSGMPILIQWLHSWLSSFNDFDDYHAGYNQRRWALFIFGRMLT